MNHSSEPTIYHSHSTGHKGDFGREIMKFEFHEDGLFLYSNESEYRTERPIRKCAHVSSSVIDELKKIIEDSHICEENDELWPQPDNRGEQELEIILNNQHICFNCSKITSLHDIADHTEDAEGLIAFYYLIQDLKSFVFSLVSLHFKIKPLP